VATRLPVVMVNGQLQQLQVSDALPLFSATTSGEVPASGSATGTKVIFDDGVWRAPGAASASYPPTLVATGETFTVPTNQQVLVAEEVVVDGEIVMNGALVEVR